MAGAHRETGMVFAEPKREFGSDGDRCQSHSHLEANPALLASSVGAPGPQSREHSVGFLGEAGLPNAGASMNQHKVVRPIAPTSLEELENRLQASLRGRVRNLRLLIQGSGIVVRGFARTYHAKQLAQHVIMRETTLPILANDIEVR